MQNILFICADQMHRYAMRCMGTPDILTPHLDSLAAQGTRFTSAYTNCPVCSPARINFLTGRYTSQTATFGNEARVPPGCPTVIEQLNDAGYCTSFVGKWHVGGNGNRPIPPELRAGFQRFIGYQCYNGFLNEVCFYDEEGREHRFDGQHRTDVEADLTIARLRALAERRQPFALWTLFQAPHYPVQPSAHYASLYAGRTLERRPSIREVDPYTRTWSPPSPWPPDTCPDFQRYGNNLDEYLRLYYAMVTQIDANVGRILAELDRLNLRQNTTILFSSDHGDMQGSHGLLNKCLPHEMSAGVPLLVQTPGGKSGQVLDTPVSGIDFAPTMLACAGLSAPADLPGRSLLDATRGQPLASQPVFSERPEWQMVREGTWKLVQDAKPPHAPTMLFNLSTDPHEQENLANRPAHADIQRHLSTLLAHWRTQVTRSASRS